MNNYYLLIYLKSVIFKKILHAEFCFAISPHKDVLEMYFKIKGEMVRLISSTDPRETALFTDDYRPPKKRNVLHFFTELEGAKVKDVTLAKFDRLFTVHFENGYSLMFKLYGHDVNFFLIKNNVVHDAFKHPETVKNETPPQPQQPEFDEEVSVKKKPKNQLTSLNPLLPRSLLKPLIKQHNVGTMLPDEVKTFTEQITNAMLNDPHPRALKNGKITLWNENILNLPTEQSFDSVNNAVRYVYRNAVHLRRLHNKKEQIIRFLNRWLKKKRAEYKQLLQADKSLKRAERYEKYGHLLMTKAHEIISNDIQKLEINDIYEDNEPIKIPVNGKRSIAENAENYYDKAQSAQKSYKKAKQRAPKVKDEINKTERLAAQAKKIERLPELNKWVKQNKGRLAALGFASKGDDQSTSPFRKFMIGKYEVWIGKNAKSNDKLTTLAHKEDIWLHARGLPGSHTVIRMGNQKGYPPKKVVLRAASYAAYYSKAKGMKTAPVIVTKRKYVYKPKGTDPGTVVVNREQVEMVPPAKP